MYVWRERERERERESQRGPVCVRTPDLRYSSAGHEDFEPNISTQSAETQENATVVLSSRKGPWCGVSAVEKLSSFQVSVSRVSVQSGCVCTPSAPKLLHGSVV